VNFEQFSLNLPTLHQLTQGPLRQVRALDVTPTRELAEQIYEVSVDLGRNTKVSSVSIYGGVSKGPQVAVLQRGAETVVVCPDRLLDFLSDSSIDLSHVETLVLDEAGLGSLQDDVLSGEFYAN
jgi:ATP-dependent RNA helicase RhlE